MYDLGLHPGGLLTGMKMYSPAKLPAPVIGPAFTVKVGVWSSLPGHVYGREAHDWSPDGIDNGHIQPKTP